MTLFILCHPWFDTYDIKYTTACLVFSAFVLVWTARLYSRFIILVPKSQRKWCSASLIHFQFIDSERIRSNGWFSVAVLSTLSSLHCFGTAGWMRGKSLGP